MSELSCGRRRTHARRRGEAGCRRPRLRTARRYDYSLDLPLPMQGLDGVRTGDLEIDAKFVCRTTALDALVGWLREPEVRAFVMQLHAGGCGLPSPQVLDEFLMDGNRILLLLQRPIDWGSRRTGRPS